MSIPKTVLLAALAADTTIAQHIGYWSQPTHNRTESRLCSVVENQDELLGELRALKWDLSRTPVIDWKEDCAVIIAPDHYYQNFDLAFFRLWWDGEESAFFAEWGWANPDQESASGGSITLGSKSPGREVMVISFKHYMHAKNKFVCEELKPQ